MLKIEPKRKCLSKEGKRKELDTRRRYKKFNVKDERDTKGMLHAIELLEKRIEALEKQLTEKPKGTPRK